MRAFPMALLAAALFARAATAQTLPVPSSQLPTQAAVLSPATKTIPAIANPNAPITIHLINQPAQAAVQTQQVAYVVTTAAQAPVVAATPSVTTYGGTLRHPGPIRQLLGAAGAQLELLRHDRIRIDPTTSAAPPVQVQVTSSSPVTMPAPVYAPAPPPPQAPVMAQPQH